MTRNKPHLDWRLLLEMPSEMPLYGPSDAPGSPWDWAATATTTTTTTHDDHGPRHFKFYVFFFYSLFYSAETGRYQAPLAAGAVGGRAQLALLPSLVDSPHLGADL